MSADIVDDLPGAVARPVRQHADSIDIAAPPERVWSLVTALERYGEWSSENTGGYWRKGADGQPGTGEVGDQFVGINRLDGVEWKAPVEIIRKDAPKDFAFVTGGLQFNVALWRYQLAAVDGGTRLTESWTLRNPTETMVGEEIDRREGNAKRSIRATLEAMKAAAEAG